MLTIRHELPSDTPAREALLDEAFGDTRRKKTSERLRRGRQPAAAQALRGLLATRLAAGLIEQGLACGGVGRKFVADGEHALTSVSRMQRSAISAFTRVFDALWRCAADPGPRLREAGSRVCGASSSDAAPCPGQVRCDRS